MGYGTEAAAAIMQLFFERVGCRELIAMHEIGNDASGRVMEKCGMQRIPRKNSDGSFRPRCPAAAWFTGLRRASTAHTAGR